MEIVVEETVSVKEVSLAAFKSLCHAWDRSAAPGELCLIILRHFRAPGDTEAVFQLQKASRKNALIFHQVAKRHPCFFPRMNAARVLHAWLAVPFIHSSPQHDRRSWQSLPQFPVAHQTLNAWNWSEKSQEELCTEWRKWFSVLPIQTSGTECQRLWVVAGKCWVCSLTSKGCNFKLWDRICSSKATKWQRRFLFNAL